MIVTPGITLGPTETIDNDKLNDGFNPTVTLEQADLDPFLTENPNPNYLRNGNFSSQLWQRGTGQVSCPVNTITYRADWWGVKPEMVTSAGLPTPATVKYEQGGTGPTASPLSLDTLKLTGDSTGEAIAAVDILQDIPARISYALRTTVTFTVYVFNNSGAAFTPTLYFDTADAEDNFSAVTNRTSTAGTSCTNAAWTKQTFSVNLAAVTNMANGLRLRLRLPSPALSTNAKTVQLAQAKLERGSAATSFVVERDETEEPGLSGDDIGGVPLNYFDNPTFADETWLATSGIALTENLAVGGGPRGWLCRAAGATAAVLDKHVDSNITVPRITGGTSVSTVDFIQDIPRSVAMALVARTMTVSLQLYNNSGAAFTPTLRIDTCDAENTFGTVTNRKDQSLSECPNGSWTSLSHSFAPDALTNYGNGFRLYIRIPSGSLDSNGKTVFFKEPQFVDGAIVPSWTPPVERFEASFVGQRGVSIVYGAGSPNYTVTCEEGILQDASGRRMLAGPSGALTLDTATTGAGGLDTGSLANVWYYIYRISNGIAQHCLMSASGTAPTLPAGYSYFARIGAIVRIGGSFKQLVQSDDVAMIEPFAVVSGTGPAAADTFQTLDISAMVPPIAKEIFGYLGMTSTAAGNLVLAPSSHSITYHGAVYFNSSGQTVWAAPPGAPAAFGACVPFRLPLRKATNPVWASSATTANKLIVITGYRL